MIVNAIGRWRAARYSNSQRPRGGRAGLANSKLKRQ
jgi:hypothetical protein